MQERGYIQVYTGNGKGKTTAALGLTLRAVGAGKKVYFAQFVKGMAYAEVEVLRQLPFVRIKQYGHGCFIVKEPTRADIDAAREGLAEVDDIIRSDAYDMVVLDEATIAIYYHLFPEDELMEVIGHKPARTEIIITGRYASPRLMEAADLVTEMREVKHYYQQGVEARKGIEC